MTGICVPAATVSARSARSPGRPPAPCTVGAESSVPSWPSGPRSPSSLAGSTGATSGRSRPPQRCSLSPDRSLAPVLTSHLTSGSCPTVMEIIMTNARTCALYIRVSSDGQCLDNQRPELMHLAQARGLEIVEVYEEKVSAVKHRPAYERMLRDAHRGRWRTLRIWSLDRFGVQVVSVRESWLDTASPVRLLLLAVFPWVAEAGAPPLLGAHQSRPGSRPPAWPAPRPPSGGCERGHRPGPAPQGPQHPRGRPAVEGGGLDGAPAAAGARGREPRGQCSAKGYPAGGVEVGDHIGARRCAVNDHYGDGDAPISRIWVGLPPSCTKVGDHPQDISISRRSGHGFGSCQRRACAVSLP
jgi:hypothetical protein